MRGHIRQRGKNSWEISIYLGKDHLGKKRYARETVRGSKDDAELRLAGLIQEIGTSRYAPPSRMTVAEFLNRWLHDYAKNAVRQATYDMYEMLVRIHIAPELGHIRLERLTPMDVQRFLARKRTGPRADGKPGNLSPTTVRHIYNILRMALRYAVKWGLIPKSPAEVVDPPRLEHKDVSAWSQDEAERFLTEARKERLYPAFTLGPEGWP